MRMNINEFEKYIDTIPAIGYIKSWIEEIKNETRKGHYVFYHHKTNEPIFIDFPNNDEKLEEEKIAMELQKLMNWYNDMYPNVGREKLREIILKSK